MIIKLLNHLDAYEQQNAGKWKLNRKPTSSLHVLSLNMYKQYTSAEYLRIFETAL